MLNAHQNALGALFPTAARTATVNGAALNIRDNLGRAKIVLDSAAGTGTTPTLDVKLQDSADGATGFADITGAAFTQVTDAGASLQEIPLNVDAVKAFIRGVATITGTGPSFTFSVNAILPKE